MFGVLGRPVSHSVSPAMHNAAYAALGVDAVYVPLPAPSVADALSAAGALGIEGLSITIPYKQDVLSHVVHAHDEVVRAGAANTLTRRVDGWHARNTDGAGLLAGLGDPLAAGTRVAVLGTGGAARAAAVALRDAGGEVTCYGRDRGRAEALAAELGVAGAARPVAAGSWDLLVNATPVGTHPAGDATAFPEGAFTGRAVFDMVYNPPRTRLLRDADAAGCRAVGGLAMLVEQARLQIQEWTGRLPDASVLREAALWKLSTFTDPS